MADADLLLEALGAELELLESLLSGLDGLHYGGNGAVLDALVLESLEQVGFLVKLFLSLRRDACGALDPAVVGSALGSALGLADRYRSLQALAVDDGVRRVLGLLVAGQERHVSWLAGLR
jgi:hypothetical protein